MITVYAIVRESWKPEEGYLALFTGDVFLSKKDAIRAADDMPTGLRVERLRVPDGRIEFTDGVAHVDDWNRVLTKDLRFMDWNCHDWVWHFSESMDASFYNGTAEYSIGDLRKCCDWWKFVGVDQLDVPKMVVGCPWFMDRPECSGIVINTGDWALLLSYHPGFAGRCTSWDAFDGSSWAGLLGRQPRFAKFCDWDKLDGADWCQLLQAQPRFAKFCDWDKLDGQNWVSLLMEHPRFAKECNWQCLRGRDWCELLVEQPTLKTHIIRERLKDGTLAGCGWMVGFLEKFPEFIVDCNLDELESSWARFLATYPQYADRCDFSGFCADDWGLLLPVRPEFIDRVDWSIDWHQKYYGGCVLIELIDKLPQVRAACNWSRIRGDDLCNVLERFPDVADICDWTRLAKADWCKLLQSHPEYGDKCTCWKDFTGWETLKLLAASETLGKYVKFDELSGEQIADMLIAAPSLARFVDCTRIKDRVDVMRVCVAHKEFCGKIPGGEEWRHLKGYVWEGASGPVVVIGVDNWIKKFPDYPCDAEERAGRYERRWGVLAHNKHHDASSMAWEDAHQVVREIFSKHARFRHRTLAIDGVYVGDESEGSGAREFALIMKEWLANNESSIKILYLECGYVYDTSALSDAAMESSSPASAGR